ncbi:MAG: HK97 family phage prohead protease [Myxococcales bacterium]|nr:HK97 family phage prohead protease [Myxococcales bacterium]
MQTRDTAKPTERESAIVYKMFELRAAEGEGAERSFDVIASTEAVDSYGDIVKANWRLERYANNPIVLFGHNTRDPSCVIGTASDVKVEGAALKARITLVDAETNPEAERVFKLMKAGALRGISVGFLPHSYGWAKVNDQEAFVLDDNELFEISVVSVPANPDALAQLHAKARQEFEAKNAAPVVETREVAERAIETKSDDETTSDHPRAQLARLAMELTGAEDAITAQGALRAMKATADEAPALTERAVKAEAEVIALKRAALLERAVVEGKLTKHADDARRAHAEKCDSLESLEAYLGTLQVRGAHMGAKPQPAARSVESGDPSTVTLTDEEIRIAKMCGNSLEDVLASKRAWLAARPSAANDANDAAE